MKVIKNHQQQIRAAISEFDTEETREAYRTRKIARADTVKDIDERYRWDLYWFAARFHEMPDWKQYGYNMDHIDTALRSIVKPLEA